MALGLPVVSTNVGGIPYLLEHNNNALLVDDDDIDDMINQINRLFTEPNLANNLSEKGKDSVKNFDWEIVKNQWIELLV
jgi:glycosyltransferase involved in cell wall biosynthesis